MSGITQKILQFEEAEINILFPFYILLDQKMQILKTGPSIKKIIPALEGKYFFDEFRFKRPFGKINELNDLQEYHNQILILESRYVGFPLFRGQVLRLDRSHSILLLSPWITDADDLAKHGLSIPDFAIHDSITDMLQLLTNSKIIANDLEKSIVDLRVQKVRLEESENQLWNNYQLISALIENMKEGVLFESEDGRIVFVNQIYCDLFSVPKDFDSIEEQSAIRLLENSKSCFKYPDTQFKRVKEILDAKITVQNELIEMASGVTLERDFIPIFRKRKFQGFLWVYKDISHIKKIEQELKVQKQRAEQLLHSKDIFMANMSHEIRNPINIIMGINNLLKSTNLNIEQREYINLIESSSESLLSLVNDIMDFEKIEARKVHINHVQFNLDSLLKELAAAIRYTLENKGLSFNSNCEPDVPAEIMGDPLRLKQILINLIGNAIKFTVKGEVQIHTSVTSVNGKKLIIFKVSDTGIGIPKDQLMNIFKRYFQSPDSTNLIQNKGGVGLGLTIVKNLVELQGGMIEVESEVGKGSVFTIMLPLEVPTRKDVITSPTSPLQLSVKNGFKILVVEDNRANQIILKRILENLGFESQEAFDGKQALSKIQEDHFDLILMDIQMPVLNGYETTNEIRKHVNVNIARTPILAVSANVLQGEQDKCLAVGMNGYISKPFKPKELEDKIYELIKGTFNTTHLNLDYLKSIANNDEEWIKDVLHVFQEQVTSIVEELNNANHLKNSSSILKNIHKLKSLLKSVGAVYLYSLVLEIENEINADKELHDSLRSLSVLIRGIRELLIEIRNSLKGGL